MCPVWFGYCDVLYGTVGTGTVRHLRCSSSLCYNLLPRCLCMNTRIAWDGLQIINRRNVTQIPRLVREISLPGDEPNVFFFFFSFNCETESIFYSSRYYSTTNKKIELKFYWVFVSQLPVGTYRTTVLYFCLRYYPVRCHTYRTCSFGWFCRCKESFEHWKNYSADGRKSCYKSIASFLTYVSSVTRYYGTQNLAFCLRVGLQAPNTL